MNILILGTGNAQVDAIQYLKVKGHTVYALSYRDEGPGREYADHFSVIDIVDSEKVMAYASEHAIDLIYSTGSDVAIPTIAHVSENQNLPYFVDKQTAFTMHHKGAFRTFLAEHRIKNVDFAIYRKIDELIHWSLFPAIIKPVDSQGQRGVFAVSHRQDLVNNFNKSLSFSRSGTAIIENFIPGSEISVNIYMVNGEMKYAFVSDRSVVPDAPGGIPKSHSIPSAISKQSQQQAVKLASETIKALRIKNGPIYMQMKVCDKGVFIIEGAPRLDGCHLWRLINEGYGVDLLNLTFTHLLDMDSLHFTKPTTLSERISLEFFLEKPGRIFSKKACSYDSGDTVVFYYNEGDMILPVNGIMEKVGYKISKKGSK